MYPVIISYDKEGFESTRKSGRLIQKSNTILTVTLPCATIAGIQHAYLLSRVLPSHFSMSMNVDGKHTLPLEISTLYTPTFREIGVYCMMDREECYKAILSREIEEHEPSSNQYTLRDIGRRVLLGSEDRCEVYIGVCHPDFIRGVKLFQEWFTTSKQGADGRTYYSSEHSVVLREMP